MVFIFINDLMMVSRTTPVHLNHSSCSHLTEPLIMPRYNFSRQQWMNIPMPGSARTIWLTGTATICRSSGSKSKIVNKDCEPRQLAFWERTPGLLITIIEIVMNISHREMKYLLVGQAVRLKLVLSLHVFHTKINRFDETEILI